MDRSCIIMSRVFNRERGGALGGTARGVAKPEGMPEFR